MQLLGLIAARGMTCSSALHTICTVALWQEYQCYVYLLRVPVCGAAHTQSGGFAVKLVAVAAGGNGVQACAVRHLLAAAVDLGAL